MGMTADELSAHLYDLWLPDWPGEIEFYQGLAEEATSRGGAILEIACGTGRVTMRLAEMGLRVVGIDLSAEMLAVARRKSVGRSNPGWIRADMRSFDLGERFGLVLIPGHSFQHMLTAEDQAACLGCVHRHLALGGTLVIHVDHQDPAWLGEIGGARRGVPEPEQEVRDPERGTTFQVERAWSYERSSQTATVRKRWVEVDSAGRIVGRWEKDPLRLHCLFRFEMEHLLARSGFEIEAVYGDFRGSALGDESNDMIWVAGPA